MVSSPRASPAPPVALSSTILEGSAGDINGNSRVLLRAEGSTVPSSPAGIVDSVGPLLVDTSVVLELFSAL